MLSFTKNRNQPQNRQVCLTIPAENRAADDFITAALRLVKVG
jgi:hypothetical protein